LKKARRKRFFKLRQIRQERDYQCGLLQFENRPYSFPSITPRLNGRPIMTTTNFIKKHKLEI
jgi:hypothetical protein